MKYPKKLMSISELVDIGYARKTLSNWVNIKGFPSRKTGFSKNAKYKIDTDEFEKWQIKNGLLQQTKSNHYK